MSHAEKQLSTISASAARLKEEIARRTESAAGLVKGASRMAGKDCTSNLFFPVYIIKERKKAEGAPEMGTKNWEVLVGRILENPDMNDKHAKVDDGAIHIRPCILGKGKNGKRAKMDPPPVDDWHTIPQFSVCTITIPQSIELTPGSFAMVSRLQVSWTPPKDVDYINFEAPEPQYSAFVRADVVRPLSDSSVFVCAYEILRRITMRTTPFSIVGLDAFRQDSRKKFGKEMKWVVCVDPVTEDEILSSDKGAIARFYDEDSTWFTKSEQKGEHVIAAVNFMVTQWLDEEEKRSPTEVLVRTFVNQDMVVSITGVTHIEDWKVLGPYLMHTGRVAMGASENFEQASRMDINGADTKNPLFSFGSFMYVDIAAIDLLGVCLDMGVPCTPAYASKWMDSRKARKAESKIKVTRKSNDIIVYLGAPDVLSVDALVKEAAAEGGEISFRVLIVSQDVNRGMMLSQKYASLMTPEEGDAALSGKSTLKKRLEAEDAENFSDVTEFEMIVNLATPVFRFCYAIFTHRLDKAFNDCSPFCDGIPPVSPPLEGTGVPALPAPSDVVSSPATAAIASPAEEVTRKRKADSDASGHVDKRRRKAEITEVEDPAPAVESTPKKAIRERGSKK